MSKNKNPSLVQLTVSVSSSSSSSVVTRIRTKIDNDTQSHNNNSINNNNSIIRSSSSDNVVEEFQKNKHNYHSSSTYAESDILASTSTSHTTTASEGNYKVPSFFSSVHWNISNRGLRKEFIQSFFRSVRKDVHIPTKTQQSEGSRHRRQVTLIIMYVLVVIVSFSLSSSAWIANFGRLEQDMSHHHLDNGNLKHAPVKMNLSDVINQTCHNFTIIENNSNSAYNNTNRLNDANETTTTLCTKNSGRFAIAYTIGPIGSTSLSYRPSLYNIMVHSEIMRQHLGKNSPDFIVLVLRSNGNHNHYLSAFDVNLLESANIKYRYIFPALEHSDKTSFVTSDAATAATDDFNDKNSDIAADVDFIESFRVILTLTQYDRVMVMNCDSTMLLQNYYIDIIPFMLQQLLDWSYHGILQKNVAITAPNHPDGNPQHYHSSKPKFNSMPFLVINPGEDKWKLFLEGVLRASPVVLKEMAREGSETIVGTSQIEKMVYYWMKNIEKSLSLLSNTTIYNFNSAPSLDIESTQHQTQSSTETFVDGQYILVVDHFIIHVPGNIENKTQLTETSYYNLLQFLMAQNIDDLSEKTIRTKVWYEQQPSPSLSSDMNTETINRNINETQTVVRHLWFSYLTQVHDKYKLAHDFRNWNDHYSDSMNSIESQTTNSINSVNTEFAEPTDVVDLLQSQTNNGTTALTSNRTGATHKFAYAYIVGGCNPDSPSSYRNYFYDIMISTYWQKKEGSVADVIVFIQMAYGTSHETVLEEDRIMLQRMDIHIRYIPKSPQESFYFIMLDKFRILELTQYDRVMFLDSDVMTIGSMDYLFELSMKGVLRPNVVFAGTTEPANGGTFMLAPQEGKHDKILQIIHEKEVRCSKLAYPQWDEVVGWGHTIVDTNDSHEGMYGKKGKLWNFHGAFADQGLLYHWVKYVEKNVSIIYSKKIEHWGVANVDHFIDSNVTLQHTDRIDVLKQSTIVKERKCLEAGKRRPCRPPYSDFVHFTGTDKPWLKGPAQFPDYKENPYASASHYWFYTLDIINQEMNLTIDFNNWLTRQRPKLGLYPKHFDAYKKTYRNTILYRRGRRKLRQYNFFFTTKQQPQQYPMNSYYLYYQKESLVIGT